MCLFMKSNTETKEKPMTDTPIYEQLAAERFRDAMDAEYETVTIPLRGPSLWARLVERLRP